jgi:hypothetical protein
MSRVSVQDAEPGDDFDDFDPDLRDDGPESGGGAAGGSSRGGQDRRREPRDGVEVEIEREVTKRAIIDAVTRLLTVILYMAFTLVRERDAGVVALDPEDDDLGPEDDWAEA